MAAQPEKVQPEYIGKPIKKPEADRLPPNSVESEEALLSSLLSGCDIRSALLENLKPEHFWIERNGWIFAAMMDLYRRDRDVKFDTIVVGERLKERDEFEKLGGISYLEKIANAAMVYQIG
jgi:replicative DNA helicase